MDTALLKTLVAGAGSTSQFIGGLVVAILYAVVGVLGAIGSIVVVRRMFGGRWEQKIARALGLTLPNSLLPCQRA